MTSIRSWFPDLVGSDAPPLGILPRSISGINSVMLSKMEVARARLQNLPGNGMDAGHRVGTTHGA